MDYLIGGVLKIGTTSLLIAPALMLSGFFSIGAASPDVVISPESASIGGYTKAQFIESAAELGIRTEVSESAWGDKDLMATIPVTSVLVDEGTKAVKSANTLAPAAQYYSKSCYHEWTNLFGGKLASITLNKTWATNGNAVVPQSAFYSTTEGFGWAFTGLTISQDYFGYAGGDPNGAHSSDRQGRWTWGYQGDSHALTVKITAYAWSPAVCTKW